VQPKYAKTIEKFQYRRKERKKKKLVKSTLQQHDFLMYYLYIDLRLRKIDCFSATHSVFLQIVVFSFF